MLALLQASITGAGLVFAAYALIVTLYDRILRQRADKYANVFSRLYKRMQELSNAKVTDENKTNLVETFSDIKGLNIKLDSAKSLPKYLRFGIGIIFFGYIVSTFFSVLWLIDLPNADYPLLFFFTASTILFLIVGLASIREINSIMVNDYEKILGESLYREAISLGIIDGKQIEEALKKVS